MMTGTDCHLSVRLRLWVELSDRRGVVAVREMCFSSWIEKNWVKLFRAGMLGM